MASGTEKRAASVTRRTKETEISDSVAIDGAGRSDISTGIGFFDHMLEQLSRHSLIDMTIKAKGELHIDDHHTVEDTGIAIGQAISKALGERRGIAQGRHIRYRTRPRILPGAGAECRHNPACRQSLWRKQPSYRGNLLQGGCASPARVSGA